MPKWQWILKQFTSRLWVRASLFCIAGVVTALSSFIAKDFIPEDISRKMGSESVFSILEIIANSMLAVTIFSLSTMVAAYAAATSNATPRSTKLLLADSTAQTALSTFIGAFLFSLVSIVALHMGIYGNSGRLVLFAVTIVVIIIMVVVLIRWIEHLSTLGRVGQIIQMVEETTEKVVCARLERPCLGGKAIENAFDTQKLYGISHDTIGYIQHIDMQKLSEIANEHKMEFYIHRLPGSFTDATAPVIFSTAKLDKETMCEVQNAFSIGDERSFDQDMRYGFVVLSEIASRALSPAVNDPGTAIAVIASTVRLLAPWVSRKDEREAEFPNLHVSPLSLEDVFDDVFTPLARDGAAMVEVCIRLQKAYASLAAMGDNEAKKQARHFSKLSLERALAKLTLEADKNRVRAVGLP